MEWTVSAVAISPTADRMVRRYMPAYRRSKKVVAKMDREIQSGNGGNIGQGDRIAPSQWKQDNQSRYQR